MEYKCPYSSTLVSTQFSCMLATQVVRRGGPEMACASSTAHTHCSTLFQHMQQAALPAFGVENAISPPPSEPMEGRGRTLSGTGIGMGPIQEQFPINMPHSVLIKIQHGGLLGLQRIMDETTAAGQTVANINDLVERARHRYGDYAAIPYSALVPDIITYKLKRRGAG